jgi:CrcB protein
VERLLLIAVGGGLGSVARYLVSLLAAGWFGSEFPYGTFIVNLAGAFAIGLAQELGTEALLIPDDVRLFITTGMLGGLTTYSTFSYETVRLMEAGAWSHAWMNVIGTTVLCLTLCVLGIAAGRFLLSVRG